ncbi:DUF427 domain-containing protein [Cryobacterium sp. PH29-G1]|uniref:DUF427 domain-containing protein n=1 Tax=Cryobacterium sp. PH29-G1 TaxID=3046211 RepID=UPI0024BA3BCD|nr:DUF427 domain-containing protein [Cryobacterium sp. PH29-G1]MDJ0349001.1 DUF427 domain-containing protein [Cryobacterium sp. PH29-G1]
MYQAIWNDTVLAESEETVRVEGNHYFPQESLNSAYFSRDSLTSQCPWKGTAKYYTLAVDGQKNVQAAWYYPTPTPAAESIRNHVAFGKGVHIVKVKDDGDRKENPFVALCHRIMNRK